MTDFRPLSAQVLASPQITTHDLTEAKRQGVTLVVNNRPDGEAPDQAPGAEIERAAKEAGLAYVAIPVDHSGFSGAQVGAMAEALERADGKVLAYCRTGTRSTFLWALASAHLGADPAQLVEAAAAAGYDLSSMRDTLDRLAASSTG